MVALVGVAGCFPNELIHPPGSTSTPVTVGRLKDSRLVYIRSDLTWNFIGNRLVIENGNQPIPPDLVEELVGKPLTLKRIEASWTLDGTSDMIRLSDVKLDGEALPANLNISIRPAGHVRVDLGSRQYNLFPGKALDP
ncbi:MAG: hypothetical protein P8K79_09960 [Mariniblastus sp.]|nr:hypothetical protein [Mariniblastus sp.]